MILKCSFDSNKISLSDNSNHESIEIPGLSDPAGTVLIQYFRCFNMKKEVQRCISTVKILLAQVKIKTVAILWISVSASATREEVVNFGL